MQDVKFRVGRFLIPGKVEYYDNKIYCKFKYNPKLIEEIKTSFDGARWDPDNKQWYFKNNAHNRFQLAYLMNENVYAPWDREPINYQTERPLFEHQIEMAAWWLTCHYCLWAAEMGCITGDTLISGKSIEEHFNSDSLKTVRCYDENGNIVEGSVLRIIKKHMPIIELNDRYKVGIDHLFLTYYKGKLCHTRAKNLTLDHHLITDGSFGTEITLDPSRQSNKPIGLDSGMAMVQSTNKEILKEVNYLLKKLNLFNNSYSILTALKYQIMAKLYYLVTSGLKCQLSESEYYQSYQKILSDTSSEDYLTLMDLSQYNQKDQLELFMQLYAMLQEAYSMMLQEYYNQKSLKGTEQTKYQLMVEDVFKDLAYIYMKVQADILSIKQIDFESPTKFIVARESCHLVPASMHQMKVLKLRSVEYKSDEDVYDLTVKDYGNYFDDSGINHQNTGKTLAMIDAIEHIDGLESKDVWYIGPKSGVRAVDLELTKWDSKISPRMYTYEQFTKLMKNWRDYDKAPRVVVFDESSKLKTPTAQRSKAAMMLMDGIREDWGMDGYAVCMTGTPAPKAPTDWYHQAELLRPGFLKEGNIHKFKRRLCIIEERESMLTGGTYPHVVAWLDDEGKCQRCGQYRNHKNHNAENIGDADWHTFEESKNEVSYLNDRLKGLVIVKFKKDCIDLPEKQYKIIPIKPSVDLLRTMKAIKNTASRAVLALTLMRELSDGFQYTETTTGYDSKCPRCCGTKEVTVKVPIQAIDPMAPNTGEQEYQDQVMVCDVCHGLGVVPQYERTMDEVACPKDDVLREILDEHSEVGRLVVWGGFTGTVDRITNIVLNEGWAILRVDGRGYCGFDADGNKVDSSELLIAMDATHKRHDELQEKYPKLCFVGHPKAGGMALTLTASPTELFFSNDFDGEARMQAEDRIHRPGCRGATIIDLIHLPTDRYVLDNLKKKKSLQNISMGELVKAMENYDG